MKKFVSILLLAFFVLMAFTVSSIAANKKAQNVVLKPAKIEVFYFHFTRRCVTCNAVESVTKQYLTKQYAAQFKSGNITFKSINLDEKTSEALAKKCKAEGQSLFIISGNKRIDLTDKGFMYAASNAEKLEAELKKAIDPLL